MDDMQSKTTSSVDATIADFITIRDLLKDSNRYFQNRIETKINTTTYEDFDNLEYLYERTTDVLRLINEIIDKSKKEPLTSTTFEHTTNNIGELEENTSYLDMSVRKYESYELKKSIGNSNRNDYVDVSSKASKECNDDDNIYDNYMVERNGKCPTVNDTAAVTSIQNLDTSSKNDVGSKKDCPFNGLPAAHLLIMHSPKVGWLTMHLRCKRFIRHFNMNFKRKYYTGLVSKQTNTDYYEWWLLMYAGGTTDLKPTVCLPLNQFVACADQPRATKNDDKRPDECKRNPCKFELDEKNKKKDAKSYCFVAETPEHCEHWINLLKQLSIGLPHIESTFTATAQIRKLPKPPLNLKNTDIDRLTGDIDTVDTTATSSARSNIERDHSVDICNYSEGVYEEPEEYYKNVPTTPKTITMTTSTTTTTATSKGPKLPVKKSLSQSIASTIRIDDISSIYDTPKKPVHKTDDAKHYDLVSVQKENCNETKAAEDSTQDSNRLKIDDEIRSKLSTQLKEQSQKYFSGRRTNDEEMVRDTTTDAASNKYQLSAMRKWLFSNHLAKLRQSTNPTNFMRKSSGSSTTDTTTEIQHQQQQQQQSDNQQLSKTSAIAPSSDVLKRSFSVQPKGTKVHMIINQLEANGQLTLLSGGGTSPTKCSAPMSA
ncbi:uncharacterized protein LOC129573682 [Sitodiplosis mosellana]|uniref:uncharacterized protein LOC129573682 n=1 Tax=Sitodiplosis mosellana TaxID=263140 RepID=UPI002443C21A|nr:uncharacterized protein LOC129573682 [Sitodiplosis mosellana]